MGLAARRLSMGSHQVRGELSFHCGLSYTSLQTIRLRHTLTRKCDATCTEWQAEEFQGRLLSVTPREKSAPNLSTTVSYAIPVLASVPITSRISIILDVVSAAIDLIVSRAKGIEQAVHARFGRPNASYKEKNRSLFVNLKEASSAVNTRKI